ncbi:MaoC family dehydratase [Mesorhizobium sp. B2-4-12]|uniref:MaoC family dehydratase n=1 Tax=unclassified Mesorhizobium TaxID=325217 RepID=UPI001129A275|nr:MULTISPECIES: MaoC family dehydratase [unclassified Mesorhizobium]TPK86246.1 MaoC family dehydratase [Mesorhizobium sp. B2-4-12]TPK92356.1 MaoC family dehydratase [Mesorhizobium sp. B2-4-17]TPL03580.1 MaoC family dehydratase [Mesorhizobium sp. B2-4-14]
MQEQLYLDDLAVGRRFATGTHLIDSSQIKRFAAEYDPQPFHLDEEAANNTFFHGLAASGWQVVAITMRLIVSSGLPIAGGNIGAGAEISWPRPTRPGDVLRATGEIVDVQPSRSKPDRGMLTLKIETFNQKDEVVQVMIVRQLVFRRPPQPG